MNDRSIRHHINQLVADGVEFQVGLKGLGNPLGPAKVERFLVDVIDEKGNVTGQTSLYRMLVKVVAPPTNKFQKESFMTQPVVFDAADVLLLLEAPINESGERAVATENGRTPGGLHIPGA